MPVTNVSGGSKRRHTLASAIFAGFVASERPKVIACLRRTDPQDAMDRHKDQPSPVESKIAEVFIVYLDYADQWADRRRLEGRARTVIEAYERAARTLRTVDKTRADDLRSAAAYEQAVLGLRPQRVDLGNLHDIFVLYLVTVLWHTTRMSLSEILAVATPEILASLRQGYRDRLPPHGLGDPGRRLKRVAKSYEQGINRILRSEGKPAIQFTLSDLLCQAERWLFEGDTGFARDLFTYRKSRRRQAPRRGANRS
jgi:hypothetical protein